MKKSPSKATPTTRPKQNGKPLEKPNFNVAAHCNAGGSSVRTGRAPRSMDGSSK